MFHFRLKYAGPGPWGQFVLLTTPCGFLSGFFSWVRSQALAACSSPGPRDRVGQVRGNTHLQAFDFYCPAIDSHVTHSSHVKTCIFGILPFLSIRIPTIFYSLKLPGDPLYPPSSTFDRQFVDWHLLPYSPSLYSPLFLEIVYNH